MIPFFSDLSFTGKVITAIIVVSLIGLVGTIVTGKRKGDR